MMPRKVIRSAEETRAWPACLVSLQVGRTMFRTTKQAGRPWSPDMLQGSATTALMTRAVQWLAPRAQASPAPSVKAPDTATALDRCEPPAPTPLGPPFHHRGQRPHLLRLTPAL